MEGYVELPECEMEGYIASYLSVRWKGMLSYLSVRC